MLVPVSSASLGRSLLASNPDGAGVGAVGEDARLADLRKPADSGRRSSGRIKNILNTEELQLPIAF